MHLVTDTLVPEDAPLRASGVAVHERDGGELVLAWTSPEGLLAEGAAETGAPMNRLVANVTDWLPAWAAVQPDRLFMAERDAGHPSGEWRRISWAQAWQAVQRIAAALLAEQAKAGRPLVVGVLSGNSMRQALLTFAALHAGIVIAPISPGYVAAGATARLKAVLDILRPHRLYAERLDPARAALKELGFDMELCITANDIDAWSQGAALTQHALQEVESAHAKARGDAPAKVMFTSGSTGMPKGVVMSHAMLAAAQAISAANLLKPPVAPGYLEWLPWHHVMGGNVNLARLLRFGGSAWLDEGKPVPGRFDATIANLREVAPSFYFNVPLGWAMLIPALESDEALARTFFTRLEYVSYGGATLDPKLVARFDALALRYAGRRIAFTSAYGATETCGPGFTTGPGMPSAGVLGLPSPGVSARLLPGGDRYELRLKGANIRANYLGQPALSEAAHDEEGWYRTGDAVQWVDPAQPSRGLVFAGRVSEDFKLASGTWVNVTAVRAKLMDALAPLAADVAIAGHDREHLAAIVFVDERACREAVQAPPETTRASLAASPALLAAFEARLANFNGAHTGSSHRVERIALMPDGPSAEHFEITEKGYLNQRNVLLRRAPSVERLFESTDPQAPRVLAA